jgi:protease-4
MNSLNDPLPPDAPSGPDASTGLPDAASGAGHGPGPGFAKADAGEETRAENPDKSPPFTPVIPVNAKWGRAAVEAGALRQGGPGSAEDSSGSAANPAGKSFPPGASGGAPPGGSWIWLPGGFAPQKTWRKRHPVLFFGGVLLLLALVFGIGRFSMRESPFSGPRIAVVNVEGVILDAGDIVAWLEKVRKEAAYRGAIVRINSPGGAVGPSQEIYAAVKRLARTKPVVASMGALAASGGYYAALGADEIFAGPSTLTASIGVRIQIANFSGLMHTVGIAEKTLTTGKLKDAGSAWREMNPEEEAYLRALIADMYEEFINTVAGERELPLERVRELADGRAMTGRQALEAGLVDTLGDFTAAVQEIRERCGMADDSLPLVQGPEKPGSLLGDLVRSAINTFLEHKAASEQPLFLYY